MNITIERDNKVIQAGYDRIMDYAFLVIFDKKGEILYSNINEPFGLTLRDFDYYEEIARKKFQLDLSDLNQAIDIYKMIRNAPLEKIKETFELAGLSSDIVNNVV